jgi:hypothetical protein
VQSDRAKKLADVILRPVPALDPMVNPRDLSLIHREMKVDARLAEGERSTLARGSLERELDPVRDLVEVDR